LNELSSYVLTTMTKRTSCMSRSTPKLLDSSNQSIYGMVHWLLGRCYMSNKQWLLNQEKPKNCDEAP
jgi:hypothetical protein